MVNWLGAPLMVSLPMPTESPQEPAANSILGRRHIIEYPEYSMRFGVCCLFIAAVGFSRQLPIRVYTTADGLAGNEVQRIVRDSHGFLWFCTSSGLSRYDGDRFVNYSAQDGLPNDTVNDLLESPDGRWWIATQHGLAEFHPTGAARFTAHPFGDNRERSVRKLLLDRNGQVWA